MLVGICGTAFQTNSFAQTALADLRDAMKAGFEVYPVVDAVGGNSPEAHRAGLERIVQAGAMPTTWVQLIYELQRDWNREVTTAGFSEIVFTVEGH